MKKVLFILLIFMFSVLATLNVTLGDQGDNLIYNSNGSLVLNANLTVYNYANPTGGSPLYQETFVNAIQNGSWNVQVGENVSNPLALDYGVTYYKDYAINSEDLDFIYNNGSTLERRSWQAPLGEIQTDKINISGFGFWARTGTTLNPVNINDDIDMFNGSILNVSNLFVDVLYLNETKTLLWNSANARFEFNEGVNMDYIQLDPYSFGVAPLAKTFWYNSLGSRFQMNDMLYVEKDIEAASGNLLLASGKGVNWAAGTATIRWSNASNAMDIWADDGDILNLWGWGTGGKVRMGDIGTADINVTSNGEMEIGLNKAIFFGVNLLLYNSTGSRFEFSDDLFVSGMISLEPAQTEFNLFYNGSSVIDVNGNPLVLVGPEFLSNENGTANLGGINNYWNRIYVNDGFVSGDLTVEGSLIVSSFENGNLIPAINNTYDIGNTTRIWNEVYALDYYTTDQGTYCLGLACDSAIYLDSGDMWVDNSFGSGLVKLATNVDVAGNLSLQDNNWLHLDTADSIGLRYNTSLTGFEWTSTDHYLPDTTNFGWDNLNSGFQYSNAQNSLQMWADTNEDIQIWAIGTGKVRMGGIGTSEVNVTSSGNMEISADNYIDFNSATPLENYLLWNSSLGLTYMRNATTVAMLFSEPGVGLASVLPRSFIIGTNQTNAGELVSNINNCTAMGYNHIDCATGGTGADLGVGDELEVKRNMYVGNAVNYTQISANGEIMLFGSARVLQRVPFRRSSVSGGGLSPPGEGVINGLATVELFDNTIEEETFGVVEMPSNYVNGTNLQIQVVWSPSDAGAGNVVFGVEYNIVTPDSGEGLNETSQTIKVLDVSPGVTDQLVTTDVFLIDGTTLVGGDIVNIRFFRDAGNASDTYGDDAQVSLGDVLFLSNAVGGTVE